MSKRTSGLGRGLGDLLADNSPEIRGGATVIRRDGDGEALITPDASDGISGKITSEIQTDGKKIEFSEAQTGVSAEDNADKRSDDATEDSQVRIIIGGSSYVAGNDPYAAAPTSGIDPTEERTTRRSLKALFKSYK